MEELRASGPSVRLLMSPSKSQKTRDISKSRELKEEQLQHEKEVRAQARAQEKVHKRAEAQKKRDKRSAAAFARKTAAAQKKAAVQAAREAKCAQKQLEMQTRATIRHS